MVHRYGEVGTVCASILRIRHQIDALRKALVESTSVCPFVHAPPFLSPSPSPPPPSLPFLLLLPLLFLLFLLLLLLLLLLPFLLPTHFDDAFPFLLFFLL